jgi:hypothetical protein
VGETVGFTFTTIVKVSESSQKQSESLMVHIWNTNGTYIVTLNTCRSEGVWGLRRGLVGHVGLLMAGEGQTFCRVRGGSHCRGISFLDMGSIWLSGCPTNTQNTEIITSVTCCNKTDRYRRKYYAGARDLTVLARKTIRFTVICGTVPGATIGGFCAMCRCMSVPLAVIPQMRND